MNDRLERVLTWGLASMLVLSLLGIFYIAIMPVGLTDQYTEFYVLGPDGEADGYPSNLTVDETGTVLVGVENHEQQTTSYTVVVREVNSTTVLLSRSITLANRGDWQKEVAFAFSSTGRKQVVLELYRGSEPDTTGDPYRTLRLYITVTEQT